MAKIGHPGVKTAGIWVREDLRVMRDPPMALAGIGVALGCGCDGGGGSGHREPVGVRCSDRAGAGAWVQEIL